MRMRVVLTSIVLAVSLTAVGCGDDGGGDGEGDQTQMDASLPDTSEPDSGMEPDSETTSDSGMEPDGEGADAESARFEVLESCPSQAGAEVVVGPDNLYDPSEVTISAGEVVEWSWDGGFHNVVADDDADCAQARPDWFSSEDKGMGNFCVRFNETGTWNYHCTIANHCTDGMKGTVTVE